MQFDFIVWISNEITISKCCYARLVSRRRPPVDWPDSVYSYELEIRVKTKILAPMNPLF